MSETKHTPGPWTVESVRSGFYIMSQFDVVVATADPDGRYGTIDNEANARLIAAAPELLEALKQALDALGGNDPNDLAFEDSICGYIRAAIYKAEGDQL